MKTAQQDAAFPFVWHNTGNEFEIYPGLTKREYFAAMALQGILAGEEALAFTTETIAARAVVAADNLIAALNKPLDKAE